MPVALAQFTSWHVASMTVPAHAMYQLACCKHDKSCSCNVPAGMLQQQHNNNNGCNFGNVLLAAAHACSAAGLSNMCPAIAFFNRPSPTPVRSGESMEFMGGFDKGSTIIELEMGWKPGDPA
eukprot:372692-Pelagomonas_calceolata.AAC.4